MKNLVVVFFVLFSYEVIASKKIESTLLLKDGVKLSQNIYLPESGNQFPCVLVRTCYGKNGLDFLADYFTSKGYAIITQDVRGKYQSEGEFQPFVHEYQDGLESLDWISKQDWSNGEVFTWGSSYLGFSSLILSQSRHPSLKACFALSGWIEPDQMNFPGGAFHQMLIIPWLLFEHQYSNPFIKGKSMEEVFLHLPQKEILPPVDLNISLAKFNYEAVNIPVLQIGGWFDFSSNASLAAYKKMKKSNLQLILGPWYHNQLYDNGPNTGEKIISPNASYGSKELLEASWRFFEECRKGASVSNQVNYFPLFGEQWLSAKIWPPKAAKQEIFFLSHDSLSYEPPSKESTNCFNYDPNHPFPSNGGANFHLFPLNLGFKEQSEILKRKDQVIYHSSAFKKQTLFAGPIKLELYFESEAIQNDFSAVLMKRDSLGKIWNITDGIIRIPPHSKKLLQANIDLGEIAFIIYPGEELILSISGGSFPKYNRNPQNKSNPQEALLLSPALHRIISSNTFQSKLTITQIQ